MRAQALRVVSRARNNQVFEAKRKSNGRRDRLVQSRMTVNSGSCRSRDYSLFGISGTLGVAATEARPYRDWLPAQRLRKALLAERAHQQQTDATDAAIAAGDGVDQKAEDA